MLIMIQDMQDLFMATGGKSANEIWAHPITMDYIKANTAHIEISSEGLVLVRSLKPVSDLRILPGVVYLDRDGEHTRSQRKTQITSIVRPEFPIDYNE